MKKVISKKTEPVEQVQEEQTQKLGKPKKVCYFCQNKTQPSYADIVNLRRFLTDRAKIVAKLKSNLCSKHQRRVTKQIKYARHLALLPFTPKV